MCVNLDTSVPAMNLGTGAKQKISSFACVVGLLMGIGSNSTAHASFEEELQVQIFRYATENAPTFYLSSKSVFLTDNFLTKIDGYFESGSKGAWSVDPDPLRFMWKLDPEAKSLIWIGRDHPLNFTRSIPVEPTTALGTIWGQNQLDALNPRVSGWFGLGSVYELDPRWKLVLAYSPLFIPTFGPSLGFTDRGELNPSRYARLPPQSATIGGVITPIRYRIEIGQLSDLLLQHQAMIAISHDDEDVNMDAYTYTAPRPVPVPNQSAALGVTAYDVNAKVNVQVQFPREYFSGMRAQFKKLPFNPAVEFVQQLDQLNVHYVSVTGYFNAIKLNQNLATRTTNRASFGLLTHFDKTFDSPTLSDLMAFIRLPVDLTNDLELRSLIQSTFMTLKKSIYWINELEYTVNKQLSVLAAIRLLAGDDNSYFGDWRDQDSYSAGLRWIW